MTRDAAPANAAATRFRIKRGLDIPIEGAPAQHIAAAPASRHVALLGGDYRGLKTALRVREGDRIRPGETLFTDRTREALRCTAPVGGRIVAIERGAHRKLDTLVIEVEEAEPVAFATHGAASLAGLAPAALAEQLLVSGLWLALRARPYDVVPAPNSLPHHVFVTAVDTEPLAADPGVVIAEQAEHFMHGVRALSRLATGNCYVCQGANAVPLPSLPNVRAATFVGPHPAGLPGTHMSFLANVTPRGDLWHIGYQDVIAIGTLLATGRTSAARVVALAGPGVREPRLLRTQLGVALAPLLGSDLRDGARVISGSPLSGREVALPHAYLGRYHTQVSVLMQPRPHPHRWHGFLRRRAHATTTALHGVPGPMLPVEAIERIWPFPSPVLALLRALLTRDVERALSLGCLGLAEEDLALASYVCPAKSDYAAALRATLDDIASAG